MAFSIKNHRLVDSDDPVEYIPSPNVGGKIEPKFLVIHFTAGASDARATAKYFSSKSAKTSAHLTIDKDGEAVQSVPFNVKAWHAGKSQWGGYSNLNEHSIGIEVVNPGPLDITSSGYVTWWGERIAQGVPVIEAPHPNNPRGKVYGWIPFTAEQNQALVDIGTTLMMKYGMIESVGHDMIAPLRKQDPGPCMNYRIYDRINSAGVVSDYTWTVGNVNNSLNGRAGPGTTYDVLSQLPLGTTVDIVRREGEWWMVETEMGEQVWVHSKFMVLTEA